MKVQKRLRNVMAACRKTTLHVLPPLFYASIGNQNDAPS